MVSVVAQLPGDSPCASTEVNVDNTLLWVGASLAMRGRRSARLRSTPALVDRAGRIRSREEGSLRVTPGTTALRVFATRIRVPFGFSPRGHVVAA